MASKQFIFLQLVVAFGNLWNRPWWLKALCGSSETPAYQMKGVKARPLGIPADCYG